MSHEITFRFICDFCGCVTITEGFLRPPRWSGIEGRYETIVDACSACWPALRAYADNHGYGMESIRINTKEPEMTTNPITSLDALRDQFMFDQANNEVTLKALGALQGFTDWFSEKHPDAEEKPNLRISRSIVALCVGDVAVWDSENNKTEELTNFAELIRSYEEKLKELQS